MIASSSESFTAKTPRIGVGIIFSHKTFLGPEISQASASGIGSESLIGRGCSSMQKLAQQGPIGKMRWGVWTPYPNFLKAMGKKAVREETG